VVVKPVTPTTLTVAPPSPTVEIVPAIAEVTPNAAVHRPFKIDFILNLLAIENSLLFEPGLPSGLPETIRDYRVERKEMKHAR
jgi:hypothetical protein